MRRTLTAVAAVGLLVLGTSCAWSGTERDSLASEMPTRLLADLYRDGEHYPIFLALHPRRRPAVAAEAALVLAAAGQEPDELAAVAGGRDELDRWLSAAPDLDPADSARVLSAAVAAGRHLSAEVAERYVTVGRAAAASGDLTSAYHATRIADDLVAGGAAAAGAEVLAELRAGLGPDGCPAGTGLGTGATPARRLTELSLSLAVAAAAGSTCTYPDERTLLRQVATWSAITDLLADSDLLAVTTSVIRLVAVGALAPEGDVSRFLRAAINELTHAARDDGARCAVDLLAVAGEAARVLGPPLTLPEPLRECVRRVIRWQGLLSEEVSEYDALSTVYGVRAVDHLAELTGREDSRRLSDQVRSHLEPAATSTGYERVVLGMAFDPAAVTPRDLDRFARRTRTTRIPIHIGLVALASARAELCTPTVSSVLTAHLSRIRAELPGAIEVGNLPYLYWSVVLLQRGTACAGEAEPAAELAVLREYVAGLLDDPSTFAPGGALPEPTLARFGWQAACALGVEVPAERAARVRTALRGWLPASTVPGPNANLPRLYSLLYLIHVVERGCGPTRPLFEVAGTGAQEASGQEVSG